MAKYVLLGVGNRLRGDDGAGSILAERFKDIDKDWVSIDGGIMPESYTSIIKREAPDKLFIADVCDIEGEAGDFSLVEIDKLSSEYGFDTHTPPITMFIDYLKSYAKEIYFIGIKPKRIELHPDLIDKLSPEVEEGIKRLINILKNKEFDKLQPK